MKILSRLIITIVFSLFFFFRRSSTGVNAEKLMKLYQQSGFSSLFVKIRLWDSPIQLLESLVPKKGRIVELGSGEGLYTNYLALSSGQRQLLGLEIDKERISQAQKGLKNTHFVSADITDYNIPKSDAILIIHVLHHLGTPKDQVEVIKRCFEALNKNGKLLIIEVEPMWSWRYASAWFVDHFLVPWLFEHRLYSPIYFRPKEQWVKILNDTGFKTRSISANQGMPFAHIIFECTK